MPLRVTKALFWGIALGFCSVVHAEESSKTTICHMAASGNSKTIRIDTVDVSDHLRNHDDYIGICPTEIGIDEATISIPGEIELHFPAGSITEPTSIYIKRISGEPGTFEVLYELGPEGLNFATPINVSLTYDPSLLPVEVQEADILIADFTDRMQPLMISNVDTAANTVSGSISHFSIWGFSALQSTGVNRNQFSGAPDSWRMPIGDFNGADVGNDLSLLSIAKFQNYDYPRISFNEAGDPNDWYVATAFNNNRWLNNGLAEPSIGPESLYSSKGHYHPGEDWNIIGGGDQNQTVRAIADGIVLFSQSQNSNFGNILILGHRLESGEIIASVYAHLLHPPTIGPGTPVFKGSEIGRIGSAPSLSPHLHFEIARESLLMIDDSGYIRIPVNSLQQRGWWWPGTDTNFIATNYYNPSRFLKDREPTSAGVVSASFKGTVHTVEIFANNTSGIPDISVGDKITGSYRLNLDTPESSQTSTDPNFALYLNAVTDVQISVGPYSLSNIRADEVSVRNNDTDFRGTYDIFGIYMFQNVRPNVSRFTPLTFVLQLFDPTATALSSTGIPRVAPSPSAFNSGDQTLLRLILEDQNTGDFIGISATFDSHSW